MKFGKILKEYLPQIQTFGYSVKVYALIVVNGFYTNHSPLIWTLADTRVSACIAEV